MTKAERGEQRREVQRMRTAGMSHEQIAQCLGVSTKTVQRHLRGTGLVASFARLKPRQRKLVEGRAKGLTPREAAIEAGYSPATARSGVRETTDMAMTLREAALVKASALEVAELMAQGLRATRTELFAHQGRIRDEREVVDYGTRKGYIELYAKVTGALRDAAVDVTVPVQVVLDL